MIDLRGGILAVTICVVIALIDYQPRPVKDNQVPYCVIDYPAAFKDQSGRWVKVWARGYGPCSQMDRYEFI